jgi:uncharacterized protein YfaS (alpha-2-macroglobulin family)/tetratricopeptide (TPR) repeat protein
MKPFLSLALSLIFGGTLLTTQEPRDYAGLKARADAQFASGSFELARESYEAAEKLAPDAAEKRYVSFRIADASWRSSAASQNPDSSEMDRAERALSELQRAIERPEDRDQVWAEVEESLGDSYWTRRDRRDMGSAVGHYRAALDWWSGARDIELARERYLRLVWRMAWPDSDSFDGGWWLGQIPIDVVDNAVKISIDAKDKAQAQYLFAQSARMRGASFDELRRGFEYLEAAVAGGRETAWYDDALFTLAQWLEQRGEPRVDEGGNPTQAPNCVRALAVYRRLVNEFKKGETAYYDRATEAIRGILRTDLELGVSSAFLPDSEIGYSLGWRNVERIELAIYPVDLTRAVTFPGMPRGNDVSAQNWLATIDLGRIEPATKFAFGTGDKGDHLPGRADLVLEKKLAPGAYVMEARAGDAKARELILVGRSSLVVKASGSQALLWFCDVLTSAPIAEARVVVWERWHERGMWNWRSSAAVTAADGTATIALKPHSGGSEVFAAATGGDRQAWSLGQSYAHDGNDLPWKIYAFTDRSTYRPDATVQFKIVARTRSNGRYATPGGEKLAYEIVSPRGDSVAKGEFTLNAFGSAWGTFDAQASHPLGEYHVRFSNRSNTVGEAMLFRLEEYKLPEFEVKVLPPEKDGKTKLFRLGDSVEATIDAQYYFGGAVAEANVEVLVYQKPFWRRWIPLRDFGWFYDGSNERQSYWGGPGQIVSRQTLKTDASGRVNVAFETPKGQGQDFEYTVEARVTDRSRREITGRGSVRVTRQPYTVFAEPTHRVHRPGDKVDVDLHARDANDGPVSVEGQVKVVRNRWIEVWLDPTGREVKDAELERARERGPFPPPTADGAPAWKLKFRGYETEHVTQTTLTTDAKGDARFTFTAMSEGYYSIAWQSRDDRGTPIQGDTSVFVASGDTKELGYHAGGLSIVLDKDTFRAGETAPVLLCTPTSNRWVLFSVESEVLHSWQVVHVEGSAKLVTVAIGEEHVPNLYLSAFTAHDGDALMDLKEVIVPPVAQFLDVEITADRTELLPGAEGTLSVTTRDHKGEPVSAEVALSLVDESVSAIQADYAIDPRQFFFGEKRPLQIQTQSSFNQRSFRKLTRDAEGRVQDERQARLNEGRDKNGYDESDDFNLGKKMRLARGERQDGPSGPSSAPPMMQDAMASSGVAAESKAGRMVAKEEGAAGNVAGGAAVEVRSDFRETALWKPDLVTDAQGRASLKVKYPESLTRWKASARVADATARFGQASLTTRTEKPLIARLQAPRFFVVGDELVISGVLNNRTDEPMDVRAELVVEGLVVAKPTAPNVRVPAHGEQRVDWFAKVTNSGVAKIELRAVAGTVSDGMVKTYTVHEHGIDALVAGSWKMREAELTAALTIPADRRKDTTRFQVQVSPSLAVTMLDALPYLIDYPYGCTEQTLSRFVPAAIVARTLASRGLSAEQAMSRVFGGIEEGSAAATHPEGKRSLDELDKMTREGLARLYDFQHGDGGWSWWKEGESDHFMTAYVVWGLSLARQAGIDVDANVLERGARYLSVEVVEEERSPDMAAWMLYALAEQSEANAHDKLVIAAFDKLWAQKQGLNAYTRALFALAAQRMGRAREAQTLVENLANGVLIDKAPAESRVDPKAGDATLANQRTAHWGEDGVWWRWSEGGVEATAFALRALLAIDPKNALVEPVVNWLVQNRRGAQWSNTRDSAIVILALDDYLRVSGEVARTIEYEVLVNGRSVETRKLTPDDMLSGPRTITIPPKDVRDGVNEIRLRRVAGDGPLYLMARAEFFSLEEPIPARGSQIFVKRQYYKRVGRPTLLKGYVYDRVPLEDGGSVASGERVEVVLTVEGKNHYEYLLFEDQKPAGLEAAEVKSGEPIFARELKSSEVDHRFAGPGGAVIAEPTDHERYTGRQLGVHQELRDRRVALFIDRMPQGVWELRYELRAEIPGRFHALPVLGHAMYVPEIRCNSDEVRISVEERGPTGE